MENVASPVVTDVSNHQRIIEDFVDAICGQRAPVCDGVEGRRSVAVVEAIYRSAREQRRVDVELRNGVNGVAGTDPSFQRLP